MLEKLKAAYAAARKDGDWDVHDEPNADLLNLLHEVLPALIECAEALRGLTTVCDAGQSADYRALQELRTMREARAALAKLENAR